MRKRRINRLVTAAALSLAVPFLVCACGNVAKPSDKGLVNDEVTAVADGAATDISDNIKQASGNKTYVYKTFVDDGEMGGGYEQLYTLEIVDDTNAVFYDECVYSDVHRYVAEYAGEYSASDNKLRFEYNDPKDTDWRIAYIFMLDGDEVTEVVSDTDGQSSVAGVYKASSDEYGEMILTVSESGKVSLNIDGADYEATLGRINDKWNLMAYDSNYERSIDLYIEFEGDTFTYEQYSYTDYAKYAGDLDINGDLGVINLLLDNEGGAVGSAVIDGSRTEFSGTYYVDTERECVSSISLYSESGYSLELYIEDIGEEMPNYSGSISRTLGAG